MSFTWFRMYAEFANDAKVQSMPEVMQRRLVMIFCLRCSNVTETLSDEELAFQLRISVEELAETKEMFLRKGFIEDDWSVRNWAKRQFISDSSAERVRRHRAKREKQGLVRQNYFPPKLRASVYERDGCSCVYCGSKEDLTLDHAVPESRGGSNEMSNLLTACRACNASKRDLTLEEYCKKLGDETLLKRITNVVYTDKETEENLLSVPNGTEVGASANRCPTKQIVDLYHEVLPTLSRVEKITTARQGYIRQRWLNDLTTLDEWRNYFQDVKASDFLMGRVNGSGDKPPFRADLEWLCRPGNFAKVAEGKYHRRTNGSGH